jgi:hypothetical protein
MLQGNLHENIIGNVHGNVHRNFYSLYKTNLIIANDHARHLVSHKSTSKTSTPDRAFSYRLKYQ